MSRYHRNNSGSGCAYVFLYVIAIFIFGLLWVFSSSMEKDTFNKYRGPHQPEATTYDAMFADLRVTAKGGD